MGDDEARMASPRSIEVKVGILILTALGLLVAFILVMGGLNFQPTYPIFVEFDNPGGLQSGAPVKIAGVKVGKLGAIEFRGSEQVAAGKRDPLVRIQVSVETRYQKSIHVNALFYVTTQGVLGEQFLGGARIDRRGLPPGAIVRGLDPPRLDMLLAESYSCSTRRCRVRRPRGDRRASTASPHAEEHRRVHGAQQDHLDRIAENVEQMSVNGTEMVRRAPEYVDSADRPRLANTSA
jgi:phospholipid/cholesterol/gamma-HCH transport system substrate-binding protein